MSYPYGQVVPLIFRFTNNADAATDPTTVVVTVLKPDRSTSVLTPTNPATGEYRVSVTGDQAGRFIVEASGAGNGIDTSISYAFVIAPSQVAL